MEETHSPNRQEMACESVGQQDVHKRPPVARALQLPERELPSDPDRMGYWLGNGSATD